MLEASCPRRRRGIRRGEREDRETGGEWVVRQLVFLRGKSLRVPGGEKDEKDIEGFEEEMRGENPRVKGTQA